MNDDQDREDLLAKQREVAREKDDFYFQQAGYSTGRLQKSFFVAHEDIRIEKEKRRKADQVTRMFIKAELEASQQRLNSFSQKLVRADTASYEALIEAKAIQDIALLALIGIQERAHQLPDGRRVYLSEDGSYAIDEDEQVLSDEEQAQIEWEPGRPTAESLIEAKQAYIEASKDVNTIGGYREKLDKMREKLDDGGVISEDALSRMEQDLMAMPVSIQQRYDQPGNNHESPKVDGRQLPRRPLPAVSTAPVTP